MKDRFRTRLLPMALILATGCSSRSSNPASDTMNCVERLLMPRYPPMASSARVSIQGLRVSVRLSADGTVKSITFDVPAGAERTAPLFTPSLEETVIASTFRSGCEARIISLVFDFRLSEQSETDGRAAFKAPNHVEVFDTQPLVQPEASR